MPKKQTAVAANTEPAEDEAPEVNGEAAETSSAEKIKTLMIELLQTKADKKESNKTYNEEIKRIDAEIKDILKAEGQTPQEE